MLVKKEWFQEWFNSPYYYALYSNRDSIEAEHFLTNLIEFLGILPGKHRILDLACGKGRHSIFLNSLGFHVLGIDLSSESIAKAKAHENDYLRFEVQDLRVLKTASSFDVGLNLFTSFGYFQSYDENLKVIKNIQASIVAGGLLVIDFMNSEKVLHNLVEHESKSAEGLQFHIHKWTENNCICKKIVVSDHNQEHEFMERVQALTLTDFKNLLHENGFTLLHTFGDYELQPYVHADSDRLILIARRH